MIGAGSMAPEHIKAFRDVDGVEIVGIANRTVEKAQKLADEYGINVVTDNVRDLYERTEADLAVLAIYETAINKVAKACFEHPWAVFMEKPVGLNLQDAEDIAAAAHGHGRSVWVGLNRRSLSSTLAALEDLSNDPNPRYIHVQDQQSLDTARAIGHAEAVVKNWMYANSIHLTDYLLAFGRGDVISVDPLTNWNPENPGVVLGKVTFSSGDIGLYEGIWAGPGPWACAVTTARRRWEMRPLEKAVFQNAGERVQHPVDIHEWDKTFKPGFRRQAQKVVDAWRHGGGDAPTLDEAVRSMRLIRDLFNV